VHRSLLLVLLLLVFAWTTTATQMVTATSSRNQVYLGKPFTIDLTVTPPEAITDFAIESAGPPGFDIMCPKKPIPDSLGSGSSYTAVYKITPPPEGHATTERYRIVFNVKYRRVAAPPGEPQMWQSAEVPFTVAFTREWFYLWAIVGLFVGWSIKALSSFTGASPSTAAPVAARKGGQILLAFLFRREVTSALTSFAMGFLALLLLSRSELPTGAIHDTLALGIGLGFLSDDQLLNRIKVVPGMPG
jgi:hypothetical protein